MRFFSTLACVALAAPAACDRPAPPPPAPVEATPETPASASPAVSAAPASAPAAAVSKASFAVPAAFVALGTEPFWAAKVAGSTLNYSTPEDQAGQDVAIVRESRADAVVVRGKLAGKTLSLTISAGPCSDGMSDTVYPYAVVRRLGDDIQRGCARVASQR